MSPSSIKGKHVHALIERWQAERLSTGTIYIRVALLRGWAEKVGKAGVIAADNTRLGLPERQHVTHADKSKTLGSALGGVRDAHVRMSLQLQQAFGLRREESI